MEPTNNTWIYRLPETIPRNPPAIPGCMDYLKLLHGTLLQYLDTDYLKVLHGTLLQYLDI